MQLSFEYINKKESLLNRLSKYLNNISNITLTENRTRILLIKHNYNKLDIRVHHGFANADDKIIQELSKFIIKPNKNSSNILQNYFDKCIKVDSKREKFKKRKIKHQGNYYNLKELFDSINQNYFLNKLNINITWGYPRTQKKKYWVRSRHITLGQYHDAENLIIIHPNLDRNKVPKFFIESVIYHEICHHIAKSPIKNLRRSIHNKEFRELETKYPKILEAKQWEKDNFSYLIK